MNMLISVIGVHFFICKILYVNGNSDCKFISNISHEISAKDFKVTSYDKKYIMCGAYFCSHPSVLPLQLLIHGINSTKNNLAVYLEKKSITTFNKCGYCQNNSLQNPVNDSEENTCIACLNLEPSKTIEIYVRLDIPPDFDSSNEECHWNVNFNISVQEYTCPEGLAVNIPKSNHCNVTDISTSDLHCIIPSCSKNISTNAETDSFIHKFLPANHTEACIWNLSVEPLNTVDIFFSQTIKKYLTIYEDNLLNPKWRLSECKNISSHLKIKPSSKKIFILYRNIESLPSEAFLQINITRQFCPYPSSIENGLVEFKYSNDGTVAHYSCLENYILIGYQQIRCDGNISHPPICVSQKEKLVSDEPEVARSNVSLIELDQGTLESTKVASVYDISTPIPVEGSGHSHTEDEDDLSDMDSEAPEIFPTEYDFDEGRSQFNTSVFRNGSFLPPWHSSEGGIVLFSLPSLEDKMMLMIIIGIGVLLIVIIAVTSVIVCRNRSIRSGLNRKFDTFQNPIYEKPVVRLPIPHSDSDPSHEKLDLGDLSDSTVLD